MFRRSRGLGAAGALLIATAGLAAALAAPPVLAAQTAAAPHALVKPAVPAAGRAYLGVAPAFDPSEGTPQQAATFTAQSGRPPAVVSFYIAWGAPLPADLAQVAAADSLPMVSMKCTTADNTPIPDADVAAGKEDAAIRATAEAFKAFARPVLFRWFWEMNLPKIHAGCLGAANLNEPVPTNYKAAWIHIWTIFQEVGATNVGFVWAPSDAPNVKVSSSTPFWPGGTAGCVQSQCVDWIGADLYDRGSTQATQCTGPTFFDDFYADFNKFYVNYTGSQYGGKPLILTETGAPSNAEQVKWLDSIAKAMPHFPRLHGLVYFDAHQQCNYILQPGTTGLATFRAMGNSQTFGAYAGKVDTYGFATGAGAVHVFDGYGYGDLAGQQLPARIVGFALGPHASGYWLTGADGSVYPFGSVPNLGSMRGKHLNKPIVAMAATPDGRGYWLVASDGGIFNFGDAAFLGSTGKIHLHRPIVGMASTGDGRGYWLVASDGGMFAFGDAKFRGSMGGQHLNKPIDGMSATADGRGYWLVASDGGIFSFGDAPFGGSLAGAHLTTPVASAARDLLNGYYVVLTAGGAVYQFPGGRLASATSATSPAVQISTWPIG